MTTAAELREALSAVPLDADNWRKPIYDAARTIALPILEAGPELVERIAGTIWKHDPQRLTGFAPDYLAIARTVVAAITTPTPGAE